MKDDTGSAPRYLLFGLIPAGIWLVLWVWPVAAGYMGFVYPTYDLGIYAEALHKISWHDLNPFIEVRGLRIFTDHFDPILFPFAPLAKGRDPALVAIMVESIFFMASAILLMVLAYRKAVSAGIAWFLALYLLFNLATQNAMGFPVHPTAWSVLPITMLAIGRLQGRPGVVWVAMLLLLCCKEEFVFSVILVSAYLLWRRETRLGLAGLILGVAWGIFVFGLRDYFFGKGTSYGGNLLKDALAHPFQTVFVSLSTGKALTVLGALVVPLVLLMLTARGRKEEGAPRILDAAVFWGLFLLPLLSIRLLSPMHWQHHYSVPLAAAFCGFVLQWGNGRTWPRWVWWAFPLLVLLFSLEGTIHRLKMDTPFLRHLTHGQRVDRAHGLESTCSWLLEHPRGNLIAQQNLAPRVLSRTGVYHWSPLSGMTWHEVPMIQGSNGSLWVAGRMEHAPAGGFKYVWFEKPPSGDGVPVGHDEISLFYQKLKTLSNVTWHRDDPFQVLVEGDFRWKE